MILNELPVDLIGIDPSASTEEIETGSSFEENARLKASHFHKLSGLPSIADDSGLEVSALGGAPGLHSARYAGADATDEVRIGKLLKELERVPLEERGASFVCSAAIVWNGGERFFTRRVDGRILREARGEGGFGYDPVFFYEPLGRTFAQLTLEEKQAVSHRGRAFRSLARWLSGPGVLDSVASDDRIADPTVKPLLPSLKR